jgi:hypothetical protein
MEFELQFSPMCMNVASYVILDHLFSIISTYLWIFVLTCRSAIRLPDNPQQIKELTLSFGFYDRPASSLKKAKGLKVSKSKLK